MSRRSWIKVIGLAAVLGWLAVLGGATLRPAPPASRAVALTEKAADPCMPSQSGASGPVVGTQNDSVGLLYSMDSAGVCGYCTAAVVNSLPGRSIIATAAHCVHGGPENNPAKKAAGWHHHVFFVPGFQKNRPFPYGKFEVHTGRVEPEWGVNGSPENDLAFLRVDPNKKGHLRDLVNMNGMEVNLPFKGRRTIVGYFNELSTLTTCEGDTKLALPGVRKFLVMKDCFISEGGSGGPWFNDFDGKSGNINGVSQSYIPGKGTFTVYFDDVAWDTYQRVATDP